MKLLTMKSIRLVSVVTVLTGFIGEMSVSAVLTPVNSIGGNGSELSLQQVLNLRGNTLVSVGNDAHQVDDSNDSYWNSVGNSSASIVIEIAGYANNNRFGIFNAANPNERQQIFAGGSSSGATLAFTPNWTSFGFYLENTVNDGGFTWYSDSSLDPAGGRDHMVAYQGQGQTLNLGGAAGSQLWDSSSYILGWEDLNLGDWDYQDMVVLVRGVVPAPDAGASIILLGLGVVALGWSRRKNQ